MSIFSNLKIASKMYLMIFCCILGIVLTAGVGQYQLNRVYASASVAAENTVPSFNTLYQIKLDFSQIRIAALYHVLATDDATMVALESRIQNLRSNIDRGFIVYDEKYVSDEEDRRLTKILAEAIKDYYSGMNVGLMLSRKSGATVSAEARTALEKQDPKIIKITEAFDQAIDYNVKLAKAGVQDAVQTKQSAMWTQALLAALFFGLMVSLGWVIAQRELAGPITEVVDALKQLSAGSLKVEISGVERRDEIGDIARAAQVFKEFVVKLDAQSWIKTHVSEISALLQQAENFPDLTQTAVSKVTPLIGAGHAAFYVVDAQGQFNLLASYGYRDRKNLSNSFRVGEGLVGQCVMEKATILLTAPRDYIRISSGLGEGPPACVMVLPIIHAERVLGVLEIASFQSFTDREKAVLDALLPALATSMEIMDRNLRTRELLASTQEQAERMEKQAAQLEEQTVEMEAQQAELLETENWFRSIIETAPDGMLVVDASGRILLANPQAGHLLGYAPGELVGTDFAQRMPSVALTGECSFAVRDASANHHDGSTVLLDASCSPLPDRGGRGKCVSVALRRHGQTNGPSV